jgi:hypothetical protein
LEDRPAEAHLAVAPDAAVPSTADPDVLVPSASDRSRAQVSDRFRASAQVTTTNNKLGVLGVLGG